MVNKQSGIKFFVIATTIFLAVFPWNVESVGEEDGSWLDVAQNLLQESVRNQNDGSGTNNSYLLFSSPRRIKTMKPWN